MDENLPSNSGDLEYRYIDTGVQLQGHVRQEVGVKQLFWYHYLLLCVVDLPNRRVIIMNINLPHSLLADQPMIAGMQKPAIADIIGRTGSGYALPVNGDWHEGMRGGVTGRSRKMAVGASR